MWNTTPLFKDPTGRVSEKPTSIEKGITDNPLLFCGEFFFTKKLQNKFTDYDYQTVLSILEHAHIYPGLFTRHPSDYMRKYRIAWNTVSHDEYVGVCLLSLCINTDHYIKSITAYGSAFNWQYYDYVPGSDFFKAFKREPLASLKKLYTLYKDYTNNPQNTNAVDQRHDGDISAIIYLRTPRDRAFYRILAGENPGLLGSLWLSLAQLFTTRRQLEDGSRGGTMLLAWFRIMALKTCNKKLPLLVRISNNLFHRRMVSKYGNGYPRILAERYFDLKGVNGERHPVIEMLREIYS